MPPAGSAWNTCASWCVWAWGATRCCLTGILQAARADATVFAVVRNKQRSTHLQAAIANMNNVHVVEGDIVDYKSMQVWDSARTLSASDDVLPDSAPPRRSHRSTTGSWTTSSTTPRRRTRRLSSTVSTTSEKDGLPCRITWYSPMCLQPQHGRARRRFDGCGTSLPLPSCAS